MSTQTQTIIFCGLAALAIPLGTFVAIKTIKKLSGAPHNVLRRPGDIELQDVDHITSNVRGVDISSLPEYPTSQALINQMPVRWDVYPLPRYSQISEYPRYTQTSEYYIHSALEFEIPFTWLIIFFIILTILFVIIYLLTYNNRRIIWF